MSLETSGWSRYRAEQGIKKRFRSHAAKKGWNTRRLMAELNAGMVAGYTKCISIGCQRIVCLKNGTLCGQCWSRKYAR